MKKALIIGAGISGCLPAMLLKERGWSVTVIEREGYVGGGLRTFNHGGHPYTFGPHHFLSPYSEAYDFLNKYLPLRDLKKINYTFIEGDQTFYTYPIHDDDIDTMHDAEVIRNELSAIPEESESLDFEEFWINRVGETLYGKYVKEYNRKAWLLSSNREMDWGIEATVKRRPLESGERYEFKDWYNCYPIAKDGYNTFLENTLNGCEVLLNTNITGFDLENRCLQIGGEKLHGDIIISTISPDVLMDNHFGPLRYVGRDFLKVVLPVEYAMPENVYFTFYPNASDVQTRVVEYKKLTGYQSPHTLLGIEIPSLKNKLYPMMIKAEVDRAQKYFDALPNDVYSIGRMGTYRYIDIDDIILESLRFAENF